jgi:hypothetical protein
MFIFAAFVNSCPHKWRAWLSLGEFLCNTTSYNSSLNTTLFEVLYGHPPTFFGIDLVEACAIPDLATWLQEMTKLLQLRLESVQRRQKH